jgi:hypothetical protein
MSNMNQNNPPGKPGQRGRKARQNTKKSDQRQSVRLDRQPDPLSDEKQLVEAELASTETFPASAEVSTGTALLLDAAMTHTPSQGALVAIDASPIFATATVDTRSIGLQAIANAYGDYTWTTLEQSRSCIEKLTAVRSFDKALEIQTEFARQAYETFVADSQRIWRLYSQLARQIFKPLERFVTG